jgi:cytoskeletal protein RodZ
MRRLGFLLAWLLVALAATGVAWAALSSADRQVGEVPFTPALNVSAGRPDPDPTTTSAPGSSTTAAPTSSNADATTAVTEASSTTVTSSTATSTSTTSSTSSTTSTTRPPPSVATTTTDEGDWAKTTVPSKGGVVVVGHRSDQVRLESATPRPGFSMEIKQTGPDEVRVEFRDGDKSYEVRARWDDGELDVAVSGD